MKPLKIAGIGYCVPETVITNDDLTKLYETSDEWIFSRTGIKERRVVSGNETAIDLGYDAAKKALDKSGFKPEDIDCIISAASAPPQLYPTLSCTLQAKLGIPNQVPAFDLTAACTGLIYALQVASVLHKTGKGSFTIDEIVDKVKEIVKEEELVEPVMIEVQQVLINKYNYEIINTNIKFDIDI